MQKAVIFCWSFNWVQHLLTELSPSMSSSLLTHVLPEPVPLCTSSFYSLYCDGQSMCIINLSPVGKLPAHMTMNLKSIYPAQWVSTQFFRSGLNWNRNVDSDLKAHVGWLAKKEKVLINSIPDYKSRAPCNQRVCQNQYYQLKLMSALAYTTTPLTQQTTITESQSFW